MYQIDSLINTNWETIANNIQDKNTLYNILNNNLGQMQRVLENDRVLAFLDGTLYQLEWFKINHNHIENRLANDKLNNDKGKVKTYERNNKKHH